MDSPQHLGDTTTNSISKQLHGTHLERPNAAQCTATAAAALHLGQKFIQLTVTADKPAPRAIILRRVQDSYVNVSQMMQLLVLLDHFTNDQIDAFLKNEILTNPQYAPEANASATPLYNDFSNHELPFIRGLWIPYNKAVMIAVKFDIYRLIKQLFLIDVHDYEKLPKADAATAIESPVKRPVDTDSVLESPSKKRKTSVGSAYAPTSHLVAAAAKNNSNHPYTQPPLALDDTDRTIVAEVKVIFSDIFKEEENNLCPNDLRPRFEKVLAKCKSLGVAPSSLLDVSLDGHGKTALHYASTLASATLVSNFIELGISSPIRGDAKGESALLAIIQVTNAMEKGNFVEILTQWLWPNVWLFDNKHQSFLHHLVLGMNKNVKCLKFYTTKILHWVLNNPDKKHNIHALTSTMVNAQDTQSGNTALHLAGEHEARWFVYILLLLGANTTLANNMGVKPTDYDSVNEMLAILEKRLSTEDAKHTIADVLELEEGDEFLFDLIEASMLALRLLKLFHGVGEMEEMDLSMKKERELTPTSEVTSSSLLLSKIFDSIQELLANTNAEYERVIHAKKTEINAMNKELRDATIVTANNRFLARNIIKKIGQVDTMKMQMTNINDRIQALKKDTSGNEHGDIFEDDIGADGQTLLKFDADEPFIIRAIYDKLAKGEEVEPTPELLESLPPASVLKARLKAYEEVNKNLEEELQQLQDYSVLTAKFKKVVSFCTGVGVNEVDELLDGLLEAVEGQ